MAISQSPLRATNTYYGYGNESFPSYVQNNLTGGTRSPGSFWRGADGNVYVAGEAGTNSAGAWDDNTTSYWASRGYSLIDDPNVQQPGNDGGNLSVRPGPATNTDLYRQGLNTSISGLQGQLDTLNPQENVAKANVLNQYQTNQNRLKVGYESGMGNLGDSRNQVNASKERSLKNLRDSIAMQAQGYNNQLGAFGAGNSSAAGMINFALGQQGSRERGNVLEEAGTQLTGIRRQEEDLQRSFDDSMFDLDNWKNQSIGDITMKYQQMRDRINNEIMDARARAAAEQNLTAQAVAELQNLENNYRSQAQAMVQQLQGILAPKNYQIDPSLQQFAVQPISPTSLEQLRMPQAVNPESQLTALLRRRDEEQNPLLG